MKTLFMSCANLLENGEDVVMAVIINQHGSAPRTAGSKMFVRRDGSILGTIGGGSFEGKVMQMAKEVFQAGQAMTRDFRFSGSDVQSMDMICGGNAEVYLDLLQASCPENAAVCKTIGTLARSDHDACLVTKIDTAPGQEDQVKLALISRNSQSPGMPFSKEDQESFMRLGSKVGPQRVTWGETTYLIERLYNPGTVYIFGAGHIGQKLAHLTSFAGFQTIVLDERAEYANETRFPEADRIIVPATMNDCVKDLPIGKHSYVVIVTRGHAYDREVLAQTLRTDAGYIGMIGSRRKRDMIYEYLRQSGVSDEAMAQVHAPIGLSIAAETPEEIAVSIIGELIQTRVRLTNG